MTVDIVMVSCNRVDFTRRSIEAIWQRTRTPYRLIVVDDGSRDGSVEYLSTCGAIDTLILFGQGRGIHAAKNAGLAQVRSLPYYIDTDNDVLPPDLEPDWIQHLIDLMETHADYGALAMRPQVLVGESSERFDHAGIIEPMHVGAWLRIMSTEAVRQAGGWRKNAEPGRNNEDWWIAARLEELGLRTGCCRDLRCRHLYGKNFGYPDWFRHGHAEVWPPPEVWDDIPLDPKTWEPLQ